MRRMLVLAVAVVGLAAAVGVFGAGRGLAYGIQDGPQAQVEVSFNCVNATACSNFNLPTFGLWIWAEVDSGGNLDYTLAGCGHTVGSGGPGSAGGGGSPEQGTWTTAPNVYAALGWSDSWSSFTIPFAVALNPNGSLANGAYYVLHLYDPVLGPFNGIVPVAPGHYSVSGLQVLAGGPIPGIATQTQVAPAGK